jgi:hypothetical protein
MRCAFLKWTLLPTTLLVCTPVVGHDNQNQSNDREQRGAHAEEQDRQNQSRQTDAADRQQNDPRRQRANSNRSQSSRNSEMREARRHYMAGFVRGYYSGFADGLNDYSIVVGQERNSNDQGQRASRQSQDEQRLRSRVRGDARNRARESGMRGRSQQWQQRGSTQQITGEVVSVKRVELQNDRQQHMLLLIKNEQDQRRIVDAGPANRLQRLSIQSGDEVTAQGRMLRTRDGVPVLNAQWIEASGQRVAVQGQGQQSSQRSRR